MRAARRLGSASSAQVIRTQIQPVSSLHSFLAPLLAEHGVRDGLTLPEVAGVLLAAVELDPHAELGPGEVQLRE